MRVIGRLLVALAIAFPIFVVVADAAQGDSGQGPAATKCMHWKTVIKVTPGVGGGPSDQVVAAHGKVYGCNKGGGAAQFSGQFQMSGATCSDLGMSGVGSFEWANGGHSTAFLEFHPQTLEPRKVFVSGQVTSGDFQGLIVRAWLRFTPEFKGSGVNCGPSNLLRKIRFTNTQSYQLLTPGGETTTSEPITQPTTQPTDTNPPGTVPNTNQNTTPPPVTVVHHPPGTVVVVRNCPFGCGVVIIHRRFNTGTLAFTGSSGIAALVGLEALLIGGALAFLDPGRKQRRFARPRRHSPRRFLSVTLPQR